jgi:predicted transposase YdaD
MSPEVATVKLIVTPESEAMAVANNLIQRVRQEMGDETTTHSNSHLRLVSQAGG